MKTISTRKSIRKYSKQELSDETLKRLLSEAERTPTMGNLQLYSVVITREDEMKKKLAPSHFNQPMVENAPVVLASAPTSDVPLFGRKSGRLLLVTTISFHS